MEINQIPQSLMQMQSAFDHFNECRSTLKMTTGSAELDSLIDSIHEGQFYLFYGNNRAILDGLVHQLLLSPEKIAIAAKCSGLEPKIMFKNLYIQMVYNLQHQLAITNQVSELIESKKEDIKLLVVSNLTKFFKESKNKNHAASILKEVLGTLCKVCSRNKVALVCTGDANVTSRGVIPRPIGGSFLKHALKVIVHLRESSNSQYSSFKAALIKHQYVKTPKSATLYTSKTASEILLD